MQRKRVAVIANILLLIWFFLDMVGASFGCEILVTQSWKEDGLFFILFLVAFLWFIFKDKAGRSVLTGFLLLWLALQLYFHWFFTIFGPGERKMRFFSETIKLFKSDEIYIPDLYHIVLHILILCALVSMICFTIKNKEKGAGE